MGCFRVMNALGHSSQRVERCREVAFSYIMLYNTRCGRNLRTVPAASYERHTQSSVVTLTLLFAPIPPLLPPRPPLVANRAAESAKSADWLVFDRRGDKRDARYTASREDTTHGNHVTERRRMWRHR